MHDNVDFARFVRFANMKLFCKSANQNKNNFRFATLTKHVNNQTKLSYCFGKVEEKYGSVSYSFSCNNEKF